MCEGYIGRQPDKLFDSPLSVCSSCKEQLQRYTVYFLVHGLIICLQCYEQQKALESVL